MRVDESFHLFDKSFHLFDKEMIEYAGKVFPDVPNLATFPERKKNLIDGVRRAGQENIWLVSSVTKAMKNV